MSGKPCQTPVNSHISKSNDNNCSAYIALLTLINFTSYVDKTFTAIILVIFIEKYLRLHYLKFY